MTQPETTSLPVQRRRQARQWEWAEQIELTVQLNELLGPDVFWTAIDNQPWSKVAGILRKKRGVRSGMPDVLILYKGMLIGLELKSPIGKLSWAQKEVRLEILRAGGKWWMARSARAALMALRLSGVAFRHRWKPPRLEPWEGPFADPNKRLPQEPTVAAQRREATRTWRERHKRARDAAQRAASAQPAA